MKLWKVKENGIGRESSQYFYFSTKGQANAHAKHASAADRVEYAGNFNETTALKLIKNSPRLTYESCINSAYYLYDGGWRCGDRLELIQEYGFYEDEADIICKKLEEIELVNKDRKV